MSLVNIRLIINKIAMEHRKSFTNSSIRTRVNARAGDSFLSIPVLTMALEVYTFIRIYEYTLIHLYAVNVSLKGGSLVSPLSRTALPLTEGERNVYSLVTF